MKQRLFSLVTARCVLCALALMFAAGAAHAWNTTTAMNNLMWRRVTHVDCPTWGPCRYIGSGTHAQSNSRAQSSPLRSGPRTQALPRAFLGTGAASLNTGDALATVSGVEQLVAPFPDQYKLQIGEVFNGLIVTFNHTVAPAYGIPVNNLAAAYTAALVGSYAAYTNQPFPDNAVKPLFLQVAQVMLTNPQLAQAGMDEKTAQYQKWVGAGMFLLGWQADLAKNPDPQQQANMQKAGGDTLRALGVDPDRVSFTANGMEFH